MLRGLRVKALAAQRNTRCVRNSIQANAFFVICVKGVGKSLPAQGDRLAHLHLSGAKRNL